VAELVAIKIEGFREFRQKLKAMDRDLPKAVRIAFNEAADIVVTDARARVPVLTGAARGSVKAASTQTKARIKGGGSKAPYYPWLDFGGSVGRGRTGRGTGSVHRPYLAPHGRYIYNAFFRKRGEFVDAMSDALIKIAREAGLEVTSRGR
jgi:hypothetical protein